MGFFGKGRQRLRELEEFLANHEGVEAFMEPQTPTVPSSVLLVDREGDWARITVFQAQKVEAMCRKRGVPLYDAKVVGYPERMKRGGKTRGPSAPSTEELDSWFTRDEKDS